MKKYITTIIGLLILHFSMSVHANIALEKYEVVSFVEKSPTYFLLRMKKAGTENTAFTVLLRFRPQCFSRMDYGTTVEEERKIFNEAVALLRKKLTKTNIVVIGRKSGAGFLPVPKEVNIYESESLRILKMESESLPYFQHHDLVYGVCKDA